MNVSIYLFIFINFQQSWELGREETTILVEIQIKSHREKKNLKPKVFTR